MATGHHTQKRFSLPVNTEHAAFWMSWQEEFQNSQFESWTWQSDLMMRWGRLSIYSRLGLHLDNQLNYYFNSSQESPSRCHLNCDIQYKWFSVPTICDYQFFLDSDVFCIRPNDNNIQLKRWRCYTNITILFWIMDLQTFIWISTLKLS